MAGTITCMAVAWLMAFVVVQAHQCYDGGDCPGHNGYDGYDDDEPQAVFSMLQTRMELNVLKDVVQSDMSEQIWQTRLRSDLLSAQKSRQEALASFQRWDERVFALETQIEEGMQGQEGIPYHRILYCMLMLLLMLYIWQTVRGFESNRDKDFDPPWYQDSQCMTHVFASGIGLWLVFGVLMFTQFMYFTETRRRLSVIESLYLTIQIVTTIGYGDLTPQTDLGKVITALYALTGVAFVAALLQQIVLKQFLLKSEEAPPAHLNIWLADNYFLSHFRKYGSHISPAVLSVAFGTVFYSMYPGEDKTTFEAFYMSIITLLTVGFGTYHPKTEVGKLVACFWMLIGVFYVGEAIVICSQMMMRKRHNALTEAATMRLFGEFDMDKSGTIDRNEFLTFEFVRHGGTKEMAAKAFAKFDELDGSGSGTLDFQEFTKYVATLEFEYHTTPALDVLEKHSFTGGLPGSSSRGFDNFLNSQSSVR